MEKSGHLPERKRGMNMNRLGRMIGVVVLCGTTLLVSGCANLSLFSSEHTHYHDGAELRNKVESIERRLDTMKDEKEKESPRHRPTTKRDQG